jgi:hypothetical protein
MQILEGSNVAFSKYFPTILIDERRHAHIRRTVHPNIASSQAVHGRHELGKIVRCRVPEIDGNVYVCKAKTGNDCGFVSERIFRVVWRKIYDSAKAGLFDFSQL